MKCGTVKGRLILRIGEECPKCIVERFKILLARRKKKGDKILEKAEAFYSRKPSPSNHERFTECQQRLNDLTEDIIREMRDLVEKVGLAGRTEMLEVNEIVICIWNE